MDIKKIIQNAVSEISENYTQQSFFTTNNGDIIPNRQVIIGILKDLRRVMFPGYFGNENISTTVPDYFIGNSLTSIYERLNEQIHIALAYENKEYTKEEIDKRTEAICAYFFERIPSIQRTLLTDVEALFNGDPAANSREEIVFSYPGLFAIFVYRIAHELYLMKVPFVPRIMTEYAHSRTGIDINAGAVIGKYFFIDHGTGIVIGETTVIGKNVKLYQGVTLGGLSTKGGQKLAGVRRHPTIEDNVTIYAGATILGGATVIGKDSVIGGNTFIVESVPANTKVSLKNPELAFKDSK